LGLGAKAGGSISSVSISIHTNSGGNPASTSLFTSTNLTVTGLAAAKYTFSFAGASLSTNATYWVVLNNPNLSWYTDDDFAIPEERNLSGYEYFGTRRTTNSATSWSNFGQTSLALSVNASSTGPEPIPEPGTWAAAALLIGAAAYVRWRRRPQAA
jgi:MYXO-CTERM domain-containing protein